MITLREGGFYHLGLFESFGIFFKPCTVLLQKSLIGNTRSDLSFPISSRQNMLYYILES
jgi:hypothetical protein